MLLPFLISVVVLYLPLPPAGPAMKLSLAAVGVVALALLNVAAGWAGSGLAIRLSDAYPRGGPLAAGRIFSLLKGGVVGFVLADVFVLRWPDLVTALVGGGVAGVFLHDMVLLLPAVVMVLTVMAFQHRYEARQGRVSLPARTYVWLRFRMELAVLLVPWMLLVVVTGVVALASRGLPWAGTADSLATGATLGAIVVFSPWLLRTVWTTSRLPAGPLRRRLEEVCSVNRFHVSDILVWHTHRHLANAGVVGPTRWLRYVLLTDSLLEHFTSEEVEAVFAHEMGHVRHRHLPFYIAFGAGFLCFYPNGLDLLSLTGWVEPAGSLLGFDLSAAQAVATLALALLYWVALFGAISRRMELEADLFALRAGSQPTAFLDALGKLGLMSSPHMLSTWRHYSIRRRLAFLESALAQPEVAARFGRRLTVLKTGVLAVLGACLLRLVVARPELFRL
jgi:STE24 endopeptidase